MKIRVTADSTCDLSPELRASYGITLAPLTVMLGEDAFHDGVNVTPQDIIHAVENGKTCKTAAVNVYEYEELFRRVKEDCDAVIHLCIGKNSPRATTMRVRLLSSAEMSTWWTAATFRAELGVIDQDLPPFVIAKDGQPVGKVQDGDSLILFNFRGDRALEISMAFDDVDFPYFDRGVVPQVKYAGMLQYDGDLCIPKRYLVNPPEIRHTLTELLVAAGIKEYACSETQKYGHVTYFWNGNRSEKFSEELETWEEVPSDVRSFDECPWMKATQITDLVIKAMESGAYGFIRCNYPNGDMVGHTGNLLATEIAVESVDLCLARLKKAADELGFILVITADHGNADQMLEKDKKGNISPRTAHSLNPVPFIVYDKDARHELKNGAFGLSNVAPTVAGLLGIKPYDCWDESMLKD